MHEDDVKLVMDRAAGPGDLPAGLVDRVITGARARRRRRLGCLAGDQVCEEVRPTGLGWYLVRQDGDGRTFVLFAAPGAVLSR